MDPILTNPPSWAIGLLRDFLGWIAGKFAKKSVPLRIVGQADSHWSEGTTMVEAKHGIMLVASFTVSNISDHPVSIVAAGVKYRVGFLRWRKVSAENYTRHPRKELHGHFPITPHNPVPLTVDTFIEPIPRRRGTWFKAEVIMVDELENRYVRKVWFRSMTGRKLDGRWKEV